MHELSRIDLNLFPVLDAIATEGSITAAAKRLNLTQPAVSHALGRLRQRLDDPLFIRQGHTMQPTPYTRRVLPEIRRAMEILNTTLIEDSGFDPATAERTFVIGMRESFEKVILPGLVQHAIQTAPGIRFEAVHINRRDLEKELKAGHIDLAIDVQLPVSDQISTASLPHSDLAVLARHDHPRIRRGLELEHYLAEEHILVSARRRGTGYEDMELARLGHQRKIGLRCQSHFTASMIVSQSDLLLTLPASHAITLNRQQNNQLFPLPLQVQGLISFCYWYQGNSTDPGLCWLQQQVMQVTQSHQYSTHAAENRRHR
ncbi:LysR family transcriptional regulator [Endozoicomonadaceae bacterium StTr2]